MKRAMEVDKWLQEEGMVGEEKAVQQNKQTKGMPQAVIPPA